MPLKKLTTEEFIYRSQYVHGINRYSYYKTDYINNATKVIIICNVCNREFQYVASRIGMGCFYCGVESARYKRAKDLSQYIEKARRIHGENFDYSQAVYVSGSKYITITCKRGHYFYVGANNHLRPNESGGCIKCSNMIRAANKQYTTEYFIQLAVKKHQNLYKYDQVIYVNSQYDVIIFCTICNLSFKQKPVDHLGGSGCTIHKHKTQKKLAYWLYNIYPDTYNEKTFDNCKNPLTNWKLRYDFYIESLNLLIELDGPGHFYYVSNWNYESTVQCDIIKEKYCEDNNIRLIRIEYPLVLLSKNWEDLLKRAIEDSNQRVHKIGPHYK